MNEGLNTLSAADVSAERRSSTQRQTDGKCRETYGRSVRHAFLYGDGFRFCRRTERDSKANQEACGNVKTWVRSTIYINVTIYTVNHIGHFLFLLDTPPFNKA